MTVAGPDRAPAADRILCGVRDAAEDQRLLPLERGLHTPDSYVAVIDLRTLEVTGRIDADQQPDGLAWASRRPAPLSSNA